jgi:hypothetical protein
MVCVKEEAHTERLRVYEWNEKLRKPGREPSGLSDTQGLFFFIVNGRFITEVLGERVAKLVKIENELVVPFEHRQLLSRDSTEMVSCGAVSATGQFLPETFQSLGAEISDYLVRCYRFSPDRLLRPVSPRIVIVVEVLQSRFVEYCSREEMRVMEGMEGSLFPPIVEVRTTDDSGFDLDDFSSDDEVAEFEPTDYYTWEILCFLDGLTFALGVNNSVPTIPITVDDRPGFWAVEPAEFAFETFERADDGTCAICFESLNKQVTELAGTLCGHIFHMSCINKWLPKNGSCPMCRFEL